MVFIGLVFIAGKSPQTWDDLQKWIVVIWTVVTLILLATDAILTVRDVYRHYKEKR
jgi:hypothetical protein